MRIRVIRTGGFAGIERRAEVDTSGLLDAHDWHALAESALKDGHEQRPVGVPDGFGYEITADDRTVYCADPGLTDAQRELVARVLREGA
ncbi:protealysin inhibitor emfourin [Streptomyces sp. CB03238]|uniref:protealysin inhibitor emfourin n=1 Tax=Streptomyces sp. CB03238 TaxID=1907777 RepID=UPI000A108AF3|nr:protealysin inhibitor emfourin [Streptomyces sp. CB03238]ORT61857.1 hypothetical protein BKD26_02235 [Streptomyces sp. CB03238]